MDSKFGTDGALYVQTYDGFFRAGGGRRLYRYDYIGGPPTPPQRRARARSATSGRVLAAARSGGVSYEWDFGDGATSTEANPTHQYAEAGRYTAKLTVTYGDAGSTDWHAMSTSTCSRRPTPPLRRLVVRILPEGSHEPDRLQGLLAVERDGLAVGLELLAPERPEIDR